MTRPRDFTDDLRALHREVADLQVRVAMLEACIRRHPDRAVIAGFLRDMLDGYPQHAEWIEANAADLALSPIEKWATPPEQKAAA